MFSQNVNISNRPEVSQQNELARQQQETQRVKEIKEAQEIEKLKANQEFEATDLGKATKLVQEGEEIYTFQIAQLRDAKTEKGRAEAAQYIEKWKKNVEGWKLIKARAEKEGFDKMWYARENTRIWAENEKMYEDYAKKQAKERAEWEEAKIVRATDRTKINSQEDQIFLEERYARIEHTKKKLYEIEFNPPKQNTPEVEIHYPKIITTLEQYKSNYEEFHKRIISDAIPIQALHTLSLKKVNSVDSRVVDLVFDLLRDNHLPSLKTLDLSDNPKSIGAYQITKLADSFFSGNNNLETLDISCVYPPTTDLRAPFKASGERLVGDAYAGDYPLGHKLFELYCSVSTCNQPLSITLEAAVSYPMDSCTIPKFNALHIPYMLIAHYIDWMREPASFKTTSIDMVNHTRQILEKMIEIRDEQSLRTGVYEVLIQYHGNKVPHVVETFTWGITKCLTPKTLNKADFEWVKDSLINSPHDYHHLARIMQLTQNKLDAFICVTEVMDDRIITHDMLNHQAEWQDAFPLDYFNKNYPKGGKEHITKEPTLTGKGNTQPFDSSCKHCAESQFAYFLNTHSFLQKNDITTMVELNLGHGNLGNGDAKILAKLLEHGKLPNLKSLDVSNNQITPADEGYFAKALQSINQAISLTLVKVRGFSIDVLKATMKSMLFIAHNNGINTKEMLTTAETIEHCKKGISNVGLNIVSGLVQCLTPAGIIVDIAELNIGSLARDVIGLVFDPVKRVNTYICVTHESVFTVIDEDFANCLVGVDSLLED